MSQFQTFGDLPPTARAADAQPQIADAANTVVGAIGDLIAPVDAAIDWAHKQLTVARKRLLSAADKGTQRALSGLAGATDALQLASQNAVSEQANALAAAKAPLIQYGVPLPHMSAAPAPLVQPQGVIIPPSLPPSFPPMLSGDTAGCVWTPNAQDAYDRWRPYCIQDMRFATVLGNPPYDNPVGLAWSQEYAGDDAHPSCYLWILHGCDSITPPFTPISECPPGSVQTKPGSGLLGCTLIGLSPPPPPPPPSGGSTDAPGPSISPLSPPAPPVPDITGTLPSAGTGCPPCALPISSTAVSIIQNCIASVASSSGLPPTVIVNVINQLYGIAPPPVSPPAPPAPPAPPTQGAGKGVCADVPVDLDQPLAYLLGESTDVWHQNAAAYFPEMYGDVLVHPTAAALFAAGTGRPANAPTLDIEDD